MAWTIDIDETVAYELGLESHSEYETREEWCKARRNIIIAVTHLSAERNIGLKVRSETEREQRWTNAIIRDTLLN